MELTTVVIALGVALLTSVVSPTVLSMLTAGQRADEKRQDWARQDEVATRAAEASALLIKTNREAAILTQQKLGEIHVLVNSQMTAAMQSEYDALTALSVLMHEVISQKQAQGITQSAESVKAMTAIETKIAVLGKKLEERHLADAMAVEVAAAGAPIIQSVEMKAESVKIETPHVE